MSCTSIRRAATIAASLGALWLAASCSDESKQESPTPSGATTSTTDPMGGGGVGGEGGAGGQVPLPTEADHERLDGLLQELSADAMQGRLTGIASGDQAEQAITDFLTDTGIEVATQDVTFPLFEVEGPAELAVLDQDGQPVRSFAYIDDYREVDFSGAASVSGALVFAGYGIVVDGYDSYEGLDVQDRIVAVLSGVPSGLGLTPEDDGRIDLKIDQAYEHGAVGVIVVPAGTEASYSAQRPDEMELHATDKYLDFHADLHHPDLPAAFIHNHVTEELFGVAYNELVQDPTGFEVGLDMRLEIRGQIHEQAPCKNVFGIMRGEDPALGSEVIILGAHYDHLGLGADGRIFNGAADNATGTAVVLETAATLQATGRTPKRTVLFALWCAEEQGLWGSFEYGHYGTPLFPLADTKLMIQVDYLGEEDGPYLTNLDDNEMVQAFLGDSQSHPTLPVQGENWFGQCASDDCVFLFKGVPAYRFLSYGQYHHVAEDDYEHLNLDIISRVADVCVEGLGLVAF